MELEGKDRAVADTFPCNSSGAGFGSDAWDLLGCPPLSALCLESLLVLMKSEPGPLLTLAYTHSTNGAMTAKNTSQGTSVMRAKSRRQETLLIWFHFIIAKYGCIA